MSIPEIFASLGEPAFRDGERRVIARLLGERAGVLATGGGAFIEPRTRAEIKARATSVWLRADLDLLWDRVRDRPGRPLLQTPNPRATLADLLDRRCADLRRGRRHRRQPPRRQPRGDGPRHHRRGPGARPRPPGPRARRWRPPR